MDFVLVVLLQILRFEFFMKQLSYIFNMSLIELEKSTSDVSRNYGREFETEVEICIHRIQNVNVELFIVFVFLISIGVSCY